jgi:hypothetical protein
MEHEAKRNRGGETLGKGATSVVPLSSEDELGPQRLRESALRL